MSTHEADKEMSITSQQSEIRNQVLMKEYELSFTNASHLENSIWNTAAVLVTASIAGLSLLGGTIPDSPRPYDYIIRASIGALSFIFVYWWKSMASVWYFIQNMLYYRIVEIEEELDLYSESYISYLARAMNGQKYPEKPRVNAMISAMKDQYRALNVHRTVDRVGWILMAIWIVFIISQVAALFGWI